MGHRLMKDSSQVKVQVGLVHIQLEHHNLEVESLVQVECHKWRKLHKLEWVLVFELSLVCK